MNESVLENALRLRRAGKLAEAAQPYGATMWERQQRGLPPATFTLEGAAPS
jgi:hypothetical protein